MNNVIFIRFQTLVIAGMVSIVAILSPPALSQEKEEESILIESTITGDVDPSQAVTVEDLTIPVDQLQLLAKPLTVEELQIEAAAWFLLLKNKAVEISTTEIAIKRENQVLKEGEDADKAVDKAQEELKKAQAALDEASPGTPEYEKATQQVEAAKEALREAQQEIKEVVETEKELKQDENLEETLEEAELEKKITAAQAILEEAKIEVAQYCSVKDFDFSLRQAEEQGVRSFLEGFTVFSPARKLPSPLQSQLGF